MQQSSIVFRGHHQHYCFVYYYVMFYTSVGHLYQNTKKLSIIPKYRICQFLSGLSLAILDIDRWVQPRLNLGFSWVLILNQLTWVNPSAVSRQPSRFQNPAAYYPAQLGSLKQIKSQPQALAGLLGLLTKATKPFNQSWVHWHWVLEPS